MQTIPISIQQGGQSIPLSVSGGETGINLTPEQLRVVEAVSPTVDATRVEGGVEIAVHDLRGTQTVELRDGERGETGEAGPQGVPGVSPMATVTQTATGAIVTVTDEQGTTTAEIKNGQDGTPGSPGAPGTDGISPTISVTDITGGHQVTITGADGAHTFNVMDGEDYVLTQQDKEDIAAEVDVPVQDVQVNGTSILSGGVANIVKATAAQVKAGSENGKILVPSLQDASTFYGLAKAAGSDMASSSNPVGTYTNEAKVAIQKMLGIYQPPWELLNDVTLTNTTSWHFTADDNDAPYDLRNVYISFYYPANSETATGYGRIYVVDINGVELLIDRGKYTTSQYNMASMAFAQRWDNMTIGVSGSIATTGSVMQWRQSYRSMALDFGNIVEIKMHQNDIDPAGTRIKIYGQRAY